WESRFLSSSRLAPFLNPVRRYDYYLAQRPDYLLATCQNVANRIKKHYHRQATIVYPGIDTNKFCPPVKKQRGNSFLLVSRLVAYKKTELTIKAFNQLKLPLKIVGTGPEFNRLKEIAGPTVKLLGPIQDQQLVEEYQNCLALIVPQEEDFGLTSIEAQACGKPVIAYGQGGALETVVANQTGLFFGKQTIASLSSAVKNFDPKQYLPQTCRQNAQKFSVANFMLLFKKEIYKLLDEYQKQFKP
ncbi:MAG: glycosyltransferase, partial [Patescibacteria group bacterium]